MNAKHAVAAVALVAALMSCLFALSGDTSPSEARRLVAEGAVLVDVRSPAEFAAGHLDGALNVPVGELERRLGELPRDKTIVLYCRSGARSASAASTLRAAGFAEVHDLGAMSRW